MTPVALALLLSLLPAPQGPAPSARSREWRSSGDLGGSVISLAADPRLEDVIYAGTAGSVYALTDGVLWRSSDLGQSWTALGSESNQVVAVAADPLVAGRLVAATRRDVFITHFSGLFRTEDGGSSWFRVPVPSNSFVAAFAFDPLSPGVLYAAAAPGVLKSTDGGRTWSVVLASNPGFICVAVDPSNPLRVYAGLTGVARSVDGGVTWTTTREGSGDRAAVLSLAVAPSEPAIVYAATGAGVFRSADRGETWEPISSDGSAGPADDAQALAVDPRDANRLFAATISNVFETRDGGAHWTAIASDLAGRSVGPIVLTPTGRFLAVGTDAGVFVRFVGLLGPVAYR